MVRIRRDQPKRKGLKGMGVLSFCGFVTIIVSIIFTMYYWHILFPGVLLFLLLTEIGISAIIADLTDSKFEFYEDYDCPF